MSEICSDYRRIVTDLVNEWSENEEFPSPTEIIPTKVYYNSSQINGVKHARLGVDNVALEVIARDLPEMNKPPSLKDVEDYVFFRMAQCNTQQSSASEGSDIQLQKESVDVQAATRECNSDLLSGEIHPSLTPTRRSHVQSANGKYITRETDEEWVWSSEIKGSGEGKACRIGSVDGNDSTHSRISDSSVSIDSLAEDQKTRRLESPSSVPKDVSKLSKDLKGKHQIKDKDDDSKPRVTTLAVKLSETVKETDIQDYMKQRLRHPMEFSYQNQTVDNDTGHTVVYLEFPSRRAAQRLEAEMKSNGRFDKRLCCFYSFDKRKKKRHNSFTSSSLPSTKNLSCYQTPEQGCNGFGDSNGTQQPKMSKSSSESNKDMSLKQDPKDSCSPSENSKQKPTSDTWDKGSKPKPTTLFVKFAETAQETDMDMQGYINQRLGHQMEFAYTDQTIDPNTGNTIVHLQCPSRSAAQRLKSELHKSNDKCETKFCCFYSVEEACEGALSTKKDNDIFLNKYEAETTKGPDLSLTTHLEDQKTKQLESPSLVPPEESCSKDTKQHSIDIKERHQTTNHKDDDSKPRVTTLTVKLSETVKETDIQDYMKQRLRHPMEFSYKSQSVDRHTGHTVIDLEFPSRRAAQRLEAEMKRNDRFDKRLCCFYSLEKWKEKLHNSSTSSLLASIKNLSCSQTPEQDCNQFEDPNGTWEPKTSSESNKDMLLKQDPKESCSISENSKQKRTSDTWDKESKHTPTTLFVKLAETAQETDMDTQGYINQRLGHQMEFAYTDETIDPNTGNTIVHLQCPSRSAAHRLEAELQKSNDKCDTKLRYFYSLERACEVTLSTKKDNDILRNKYEAETTKGPDLSLTTYLEDQKTKQLESSLLVLPEGLCSKDTKQHSNDIKEKHKTTNHKDDDSKPRVTTLTVKLSETVKEKDIQDYMKQRLRHPMEFSYKNQTVDNDTGHTVVYLECPSRRAAQRLEVEIKSNGRFDKRLCCFYSYEDAQRNQVKASSKDTKDVTCGQDPKQDSKPFKNSSKRKRHKSSTSSFASNTSLSCSQTPDQECNQFEDPNGTRQSSSESNKDMSLKQGPKESSSENSKQKLTSETWDRGSKPRPTILFVKFAETVHETNMDMQGYINQRLSHRMEFAYTGQTIDRNTGDTIVHFQCPSRRAAQRLEAELQKSNDKCETKVCCFYSFEEACEVTLSTKKNNDILLSKYVAELTRRADLSLTTHQAKMDEISEKLKSMKKTKDKFLSLNEYFLVDLERKALKDKLEELDLQKTEFQNFIASAHQKIVDIQDSPLCEKHVIDIMKAFGVECNRLEKALPMYARRSDVLDIVTNNQVSIVIGETGSGKSTQMVQYLYQSGHANTGMIACTQPRKIAAINVATHVAREIGSSVGHVIGYKVGMQQKTTALTKVLFMTDHILLQECLKDRNLSSFSCIIIDEAHERSIYTDLLLGMIKSCLDVRTDLRVVITSATIDPEVFVEYFDQCPVLTVSGRMFPVDVIWKDPTPGRESFSNHIDDCVRKAIEVHNQQPDGDILVFVTSPQESEKCCEKFHDYNKGRNPNFACLQLHGKLQAEEQRKVFDSLSGGKRKIVFATNSAETSVTIPGIRYVIDTGLVKEMKYDAKRKLNTLNLTTVTKSSANQRKGRAGRTGPGVCYRLYTEVEYDKMENSTVPEILRVNLRQAMLKLIELDIDPLEFDFVISPSSESMESAVESLEDLGALSHRKITDLGKWISKLPLDPKLGVFIHNAMEIGAGLEGMVIAAACSGSSIFFRAGTEEERERADLRKIPFCHNGGDMLTNLNVFREWSKQSEKTKGKWCYKNSINGKAIKGMRDTVNEILTTLKREMKTSVPFKFADPATVDSLLIQPLLNVFCENISHYLGHPKAGYVLVTKDQRVEVHPSSVLNPLASQPEWIVFDQVTRTSRDFAMTITPISEDLVKTGIAKGLISVDLEKAKAKRIIPVCREFVGSEMLRRVVGPRYTYLRAFEEELVQTCNGSVVIVEADRDNGELKIFTKSANKETLKDSLENMLKPIKNGFLIDEREEKLGVRSADRSVRALLGAGGCVKTIFMPDEYKVVMIHCDVKNKQDLEYEDVFEHFSEFGEIKECKMYHHKKKAPSLWGQVTYVKTEDAVKAVRETRGNPDLSAKPNMRMSSDKSEKIKIRIQWLRRPSREFGFVTFASCIDADNAVRKNQIVVGNSLARIKYPRSAQNQPEKVFVGGLSQMVNEDVLRESLATALHIDPDDDITSVAVVRERKPLESKEVLDTMKRRLSNEIERYVARGTYELDMKPVRETDINFTVFVTFDNPEDGDGVCGEIDHSFRLHGQIVSAKPILHCSLYIQKAIYEKCTDDFETCSYDLADEGVRVKITALRNENRVVDINTDDVETLIDARKMIHDIIKGDVIELEDPSMLKSLFTWEGRNKLKQIMHQTDTLITTDNRVMSVSLHGLPQNRQKAKQKIDEFLVKLSTGNSDVMNLKGDGKPPGLLKDIIVEYGVDLSGLCKETALTAVRVDLRNHRLTLIGEDDAISNAKRIITDRIAKICPEGLKELDEPECVTCYCPVPQKDLYRVECCGHPYCKECIKMQVQMAITNRDFPMKCEMEDCSTPFTWPDIINLSKMGIMKTSELADSSVSCFIQKHKKDFRFCVTPDCPIVYRVTEAGKSFVCPECDIKICTSCHEQFHDGITCAMFKSEKEDDQSIRRWLAKNRANRKKCPNCAMPIEKVDGCNHMTCLSCKKHICWVCLEFFDNSSNCYGHLQKAHGSYM